MKKVFSIFIALSIMLSTTELHELLRSPALVAHFIEHMMENPSDSWMSFLKQHYADPHQDEEQHQEAHQRLPFHSGHVHVMQFTAVIVHHIPIYSKIEFKAVSDLWASHIIDFPIYPVIIPIFQPPKA